MVNDILEIFGVKIKMITGINRVIATACKFIFNVTILWGIFSLTKMDPNQNPPTTLYSPFPGISINSNVIMI